MKTIRYIGYALATVMLFAQCGKENNTPDLDNNDGTGDWSHWDTGDKFYGMNEWSEVIVGDIPLVISAPHGGHIEFSNSDVQFRANCYPSGISDGTDAYTRELTYDLRDHFKEEYGVQPYIIINHLHRKHVDQNRNHPNSGGDAFCSGEAEMEAAWYDFHNFADTALWRAVEQHGYALYIDMHGHAHFEPRLELGYLLTGADLRNIEDRLQLNTLRNKSSINDAIRMKNQLDFRDLIMGDNAFGTLMENEGISSVPSKQDMAPRAIDDFFSGGYNTSRYTKDAKHSNVYGFQIEAHRPVREPAGRKAFVEALAKAITEYMEFTRPPGSKSVL